MDQHQSISVVIACFVLVLGQWRAGATYVSTTKREEVPCGGHSQSNILQHL